MEKKPRTPQQRPSSSHLKSLATYLKRHPEGVDFRLHDWLRTLDLDGIVRMHRDANSIYECVMTGSLPSMQARNLALAACLAYGAEAPDAEPEWITKHLASLLQGMSEAVHIELLARRGWVIVTERMSIWPRTQMPYQVTQLGRVEGSLKFHPRTGSFLDSPRLV